MSNKMLIYIIIAIIVVCAAAAGYFYWQQTKPLNNVPLNTQSPTPPPATAITGQDNSASSSPASTSTVASAGTCQRDFSQAKLNGNANINIQNREVAITVKGFGVIDMEFYPADAPKTVENFLRLADSGYYDCLTFHRVAKGFVIQGGDPTGTGSGGESAFGSLFADELNPNTASYKAGYLHGVLAMANSGPNTNGSQFFIMLADNNLPHLYTIFGKVVSGLDVVDKIGQTPITPNLQMNPDGSDGAPVTPVVMTSVKIIK